MTRTLVALFLFLALVSCHGSPTEPFSGTAHATLSGLVISKGTPYTVAGVSIGLVDADGQVTNYGTSDGYGRYEIRGIKPGHYTMHVRLGLAGFDTLVTGIDILAGTNKRDIEI